MGFMAMASLPLLCLASAGCTGSSDVQDPPAQYIAIRRAWAPGERAALIQRIVTNHEYVFPYVGDISSMAPQIYADTDSVTVLAPNPAFTGSLTGPIPVASGLEMFSASWNFLALKITTINTTSVPPDTLLWHMAVWADPSDGGNHGFAIAYSALGAFNIKPINSTGFDASNGKSGAAAGEYHFATTTLWLDDAGGGRYEVDTEAFPGAFSPVTTGPYLGGKERAGTVYGRVNNSRFIRISGSETPNSFTVSFDYRVTPLNATEIVCVFPSPCTTNVPIIQAAARLAHRRWSVQ
ncbi:MAG TPA: hypothetical protein VGI92_07775 [Gemmatimonadales bacterium]|jgi:hypothetical protein